MKYPSLAVALVIAGLGFAGSADTAQAVLMHAGANDANHIALGVANGAHVLWVKSEYNGFPFYFSAIKINNFYAITSGHGVYTATYDNPNILLITPSFVGDGTNHLSDPGTVRTISQVIVYPTYGGNSGAVNFSQPDLVILKFSQPISGSNPTFATPGTLAIGDVVTSAGFGVPGFTNIGFLPMDGQLRGWVASVLSETSASFNTENYGHTRFNSNPYLLNGRVSSSDSGSPVYDVYGRLVGMNEGSTPPPNNYDVAGASIFLDLTNPTILAWILANTALPIPPIIACTVATSEAQLAFIHLVPVREYRIMRSPVLSGWQEAHRFTAASATATWSEALAPEGRMFYRLEWDE